MALFKMRDYEKEGSGVSKDTPTKRGIFAFFENYFEHFWQLLTVNCWLVLLSIPVISSGLGSVGTTYIARSIITKQHSFGTSDFFDCVKKNLKQGFFAGIINLIITAVLAFSTVYYAEAMIKAENTLSWETVCFGIVLFMLIIFLMMNYYIWTLIITFKFSLKQVYVNSFKLSLIGFKNNLIIFACLLPFYAVFAAIILFFGNVGIVIAAFIMVCIFPTFRFLVIEHNIFPIIKKIMIDPYYEKHPDEDIEKRKKLGLDIPNDDNGQKSLFTDTI